MNRLILILDNYDSFTYNLVQLLQVLGAECLVIPNDDARWQSASQERYWGACGLVLSAGPGRPKDSGRMPSVLAEGAGRLPLLGLCLGHQAIAEHFGARIVHALAPLHGKATPVLHDGRGLFRGLPQGFAGARYNSLVVSRESLPQCLEISAESDRGELLAVRHRELQIEGVQFHPESILSSEGPKILSNWLETL